MNGKWRKKCQKIEIGLDRALKKIIEEYGEQTEDVFKG